jgi:hypothetical protein
MADVPQTEEMQADSVSEAAAAAPGKELTPAAKRALAEAAERRARAEREDAARPKETGGPAGPEPTRYGDWERKGRICDF